jgi:hypothetical protein
MQIVGHATRLAQQENIANLEHVFFNMKHSFCEENYPNPSNDVLDRAVQILKEAWKINLDLELNLDAMGGVALYFHLPNEYYWISILNNGAETFIHSKDQKVSLHKIFKIEDLLTIKQNSLS